MAWGRGIFKSDSRDSESHGKPDGHAGFQPAPVSLPGQPTDVAQVTSARHQLKAQVGGESDSLERCGGNERIIGGMNNKPGKPDPREHGQGTAAGVIVQGRREAVARCCVAVVELVKRVDLLQARRAQLGEAAMKPHHFGAEPADKAPVIDAIFRPPHCFSAGGQINRWIGGENGIEPIHGSLGSLRRQLEAETGTQRKSSKDYWRSGGSMRQPGDYPAQIDHCGRRE